MLKFWLILLLALLGWRLSAAETPHYSEPIAVWDVFLSSLRSGDMAAAYQCLAPAARQKTNYRDFCWQWHPAGKNYTAVLASPLFSEFCLAGDTAYLRLGVKSKNAADFMYAYLVREDGNWWLVGVDPRSAAAMVLEAAGRNFLQQLWRESALARESIISGKKADLTALKNDAPALFAQENTKRVLAYYQLEIDNLRAGVLRLRPRAEELRGFEYDGKKIVAVLKMPPQLTTTEPVKMAQQEVLPEFDDEPPFKPAIRSDVKKIAPPPPPKNSAPTKKIYPQKLPDLPPDFGNPDWENDATSAKISDEESISIIEDLMPEIDHRDTMLMTPPVGEKIPFSEFKGN
ncbi:hypothetical protein AGMMS49959_09330 [Planctomycetales bacterium]|nr:hypothetical protein AGMMS49959_09330 [Planctomycetales bacterium]